MKKKTKLALSNMEIGEEFTTKKWIYKKVDLEGDESGCCDCCLGIQSNGKCKGIDCTGVTFSRRKEVVSTKDTLEWIPQVGDKVRFKTLEELLEVGEEDSEGDIFLKEDDLYFIRKMHKFCGKESYIKKLDNNNKIILEDNLGRTWHITKLMLVKI